ncbi:primosome assembly protein PriA [Sulfuricella sp. T08]|uniref:primosomal protein N' n=1 Tax=Sulfuricella sp. T08 TaxID=1632857 RepID=UPI0006179F7C|nr:primosomal protein N' [Sulfuricella sp. T08]GAO34914.1 primosome assembly protein PriA [Sulfuricella sp. T08]
MKILRVALDVPLDTLFDYSAADQDNIAIGDRVLVSFGRRQMVGVVAEISDHSDLSPGRIKPVLQVFRDTPPLSEEIFHLLRFCADYYHHPLGEVVLNALPVPLRQTKPVARTNPTGYRLTEAGLALEADALPTRAIVKRKLLQSLKQAGTLARNDIAGLSPSALQALREFIAQGWAAESDEIAEPVLAPVKTDGLPPLTPPQEQAVTAILSGQDHFQVWLLYGITGSGKTEVYLRVIAQVLQRGGQALVLVPEINLTPQLESRFRARFPDTCQVSLHSRLSAGERLRNWSLAQSGKAKIVLGTRLALFTPMPKLKLIVVDEEHDGSFKQQDGLRYSARDMAIARGKQAGTPVILGSATPALETWYNASIGRYQKLELPARAIAEAALPAIHCIDISRAKLVDGLSDSLIDALRVRLERGEQSLVFINRRGYAPVMRCGQCGWVSTCHRCSSRLVVHLREKRLRCHHCGHESRIPPTCPDCGNADLAPLGQGTQRLEDTLGNLFPAARILRVDRDSTRRKQALPEMLERIHAAEVDIVIGTQLLAKGHDFKKLTLVGVVNADGALYSSDFRASERLFAQLMQVAGRAGRDTLPGEVLIQTQFPTHPLFQALIRHDYPGFAETLLTERKQAEFPPFCHQALLRAEAPQVETALAFLRKAQGVAPRDFDVSLFDPVPAQMARLAGMERAHLLVQATSRGALQAFLSAWNKSLFSMGGNVRWSLDVDPLEF